MKQMSSSTQRVSEELKYTYFYRDTKKASVQVSEGIEFTLWLIHWSQYVKNVYVREYEVYYVNKKKTKQNKKPGQRRVGT